MVYLQVRFGGLTGFEQVFELFDMGKGILGGEFVVSMADEQGAFESAATVRAMRVDAALRAVQGTAGLKQ